MSLAKISGSGAAILRRAEERFVARKLADGLDEYGMLYGDAKLDMYDEQWETEDAILDESLDYTDVWDLWDEDGFWTRPGWSYGHTPLRASFLELFKLAPRGYR